MTGTIDSKDLGNIQTESWRIQGSLDVWGDYGGSASAAEITQMDGPIRRIVVKGIYVAASNAALETWVDLIESLIDTSQDDTITFVSGIYPTKTAIVMVDDFIHNVDKGTIGRADYTLQLIGGQTI